MLRDLPEGLRLQQAVAAPWLLRQGVFWLSALMGPMSRFVTVNAYFCIPLSLLFVSGDDDFVRAGRSETHVTGFF